MTPRATQGFTLLEVLVAVFIMALVISFSFQAYQGIAEAYTRASENSSRDRAARILLDRIERELAGAVLIEREDGTDPLLHPYVFFGRPIEQSEAEGFELRFVTQTPLRSPGSPPSALTLVSYGTVASASGQGLDLLREEEPLPAQLGKEIEWKHPQTVVDKIAIFNLNFSGEGEQLPATWDSTSVAQLDQLPESVELRVALWEVDEAGDPLPGLEVSRIVNLLVRPFRLSPDDADGAKSKTDCGAGVTVATCLERNAPQLPAASTSLAAAISEARATVEDACWSDTAPSPALARLKVLLSGLPGFDASACP